MFPCRSPLGLRGLKSVTITSNGQSILSQPSWAAWIEMPLSFGSVTGLESQPSWAAWIEMHKKT